MKLLITGASGLIGSALIKELLIRGYEQINILSRKPEVFRKLPVSSFYWNPDKGIFPEEALNDVEVVINLAGESVAKGRWSQGRKERLISSRVKATNLLLEKLGPNTKLINASAIGIYGDTGAQVVDEQSSLGQDFLADLCKSWEASVGPNNLIIRFGLVLDSRGGLLKSLRLPFKLGLGAYLGSGEQYMSWIHIDDVARIILWGIENSDARGVVNAVAPNPVTNREFTTTLAKKIRRPILFTLPSSLLKKFLGEKADLLLSSQRVAPVTLQKLGFSFQFPCLEGCLDDLL